MFCNKKIKSPILNKKIAYQAFMGTNYGTILQTFALFSVMKVLGNQVYIIGNSLFRHKKDPLKLNNKYTNDGKLCADLMRYNFDIFFNNTFTFDEILDSIPASGGLTELQKEQIKTYDAVVCGSDQVWRPSKFWFFPKRYINYACKLKINSIGYAPSIVLTNEGQVPKEIIKDWINLISQVEHISCREIASSVFLESLIHRKCQPVVDPTLLISKDSWANISEDSKVDVNIDISKPYIFSYFLDLRKFYADDIKSISKYLNLPIVDFYGREMGEAPVFNKEQASTDPLGFIKLINNSHVVLCDGFHGVCLSIALNKPFIYFNNPKRRSIDPRVADLFYRFEIFNHFYQGTDHIDNIFDFEWKNISRRVQDNVEKSIDFLRSSILNEEKNDK